MNTIIETGSESVVSTMQTTHGVVIKKTRRDGGTTQYPFEAFAYTELLALGAHVPTVFSVSDDELVLSIIPGTELDDQEAFYESRAIFTAAANGLALGQQIAFLGFGRAIKDATGFHGSHNSLAAFLDETRHVLESSTILDESLKDSLLAEWDARITTIALETGKLVHGDYAMSAIFIENGIYSGTIDYGDAFIGDPLMDLAYFRFKELTKPYGTSTYELLRDSYAEATNINSTTIDSAVLFYMIYWAVQRIHATHLEKPILDKFIDKTVALLHLLRQK